MARVLYAWELGGNSGHLIGFAPIAAQLEQQGHKILYVVRDLRAAVQQFGAGKALLAQAPHAPPIARTKVQPASYAEMLAMLGYADATTLAGMVQGWLDLIRLFRPKVLVADYAPTAGLAARIAHIPCVRLDLGFMRPPRREPMPSMLPWEDIPVERLLRSEEQVLKRVNSVMRTFGARPLEKLADMLHAEEHFLLTFPELDHYEDRGEEQYDGPFYTDSIGEPRDWPKDDRPRVLAYLRSGPGLEITLDAIASTGATAHCFVPSASAEVAARLATRGINLSTTPLNVKELLANADATVSYGSHGFVAASLMAGVPCVLLPTDVEKAGLARRVVQLGAGLALNATPAAEGARCAVAATLADARYRNFAHTFARRHGAHRPERLPSRIAAIVGDLAARA
jgi:UDP:flavonoid glycosyltransferase YjiC (YdhE family)